MHRQESPDAQPKSAADVIQQAYERAIQTHNDLGITLKEFEDHLEGVVLRYLRGGFSDKEKSQFLMTLHLEDLYLTAACCLNQERAWSRFRGLYRTYLQELFYSLYARNSMTVDVVENLFADMFLPDKSGGKRISQFDGRSSFSTWLSVIVSHRVSNERRRHCHCRADEDGEDRGLEFCDQKYNAEESFQRAQYSALVHRSLIAACEQLSLFERTLILWRYEEGLHLEQIAARLGVHHSTASRTLARIYRKIHSGVIASLRSKHKLDARTIKECMSHPVELISNTLSLISVLKSEVDVEDIGEISAGDIVGQTQPADALEVAL